jgi:transcriptional regulator with XRE-family HTH domain
MRKLVGRNAARLRQAAGLTQEELAERSGFSQQHISKLEQEAQEPQCQLRARHVAGT